MKNPQGLKIIYECTKTETCQNSGQKLKTENPHKRKFSKEINGLHALEVLYSILSQ